MSTYQEHLAAVSEDCWALEHVPPEHRTPELCLAAVSIDGWALQHVPPEHRTPELCLTAVSQNPKAIEHITDPKIKDVIVVASI